MTVPPSRPRTVDEVAAPYANFLIRVPAAGSGVCAICHSMVAGGYPTCYPCHQARTTLGTATADVTAFVSMAPRDEQFARDLFTYKHQSLREVDRTRKTTGLAAVLWKWLGVHEACMTVRLGISRFDLISTIPSTSGRSDHPLRQLVAGIVAGSGDRHADLLQLHRTDLAPRQPAPDRYRATGDLHGMRVLLIDDTWTTGAHAQSASAACKTAGTEAVGVLALGRWFNKDYGDGAGWLARHRRPGWDWNRCCLDP